MNDPNKFKIYAENYLKKAIELEKEAEHSPNKIKKLELALENFNLGFEYFLKRIKNITDSVQRNNLNASLTKYINHAEQLKVYLNQLKAAQARSNTDLPMAGARSSSVKQESPIRQPPIRTNSLRITSHLPPSYVPLSHVP